ncbi:MAG: hypothetical protein LBM98_11375 [Oscillospiraceae bacterium]|nr:hypothetical protein [Oscillospiraceae bacterium]
MDEGCVRARGGETFWKFCNGDNRDVTSAHGAGKPPRRLRAAPLHRGDRG